MERFRGGLFELFEKYFEKSKLLNFDNEISYF